MTRKDPELSNPDLLLWEYQQNPSDKNWIAYLNRKNGIDHRIDTYLPFRKRGTYGNAVVPKYA